MVSGLLDEAGPRRAEGLEGSLLPRSAWFLLLPLDLVDGTGAPGRAIAVRP